MALTSLAVKKAKPKDKDYRLSAGKGAFLLVTKAGGKHWKFRYKINGKEGRYSLGSYPALSLKEALALADNSKKLVNQGIHPKDRDLNIIEKNIQDAENTFRAIAERWLKVKNNEWSENHAKAVVRSLENNVYPYIGDKSISSIKPAVVLAVLRKMEARGAYELTRKLSRRIRAIFSLAIVEGLITSNPAADFKDALIKPESSNHAHIKIDELPELLQNIDDYTGHIVTRYALQLLPLIFIRTKELRTLEWTDINWDKSYIEIPGERMKMKQPHIIPLATQALDILNGLKEVTGTSRFIFTLQNNRHKPMSENTMIYALYRMGYHSRMTGHGFRHVASTQLNEMRFKGDWIEKQLAHGDSNKIRAIYNKAQHLPERTEMMQTWADYLDGLRNGAEIIPIPQAAN